VSRAARSAAWLWWRAALTAAWMFPA
jgi:hypothetical protein